MKCIYCNAENNLTSSDIITYAITGAKLTKSFVCKEHNAFTNDNYEKKFVADLDFFRNRLGFSTRDGNPIKYTADISIDGNKIHDVKISNRKSLYAPKDVVVGFDDDGKKVLLAPMKRLEKMSKGKAENIDISDVTLHKTITSDSFLGFFAVHSIAKMAYEWYCYVNKVEEFKPEHKEIVDYILENTDNDIVDIIINKNYYFAIDQISDVGTHTLFQYDDVDGYRYVIFDFWKVISYRVRMCKSPIDTESNSMALLFTPYLYHIDGSKAQTVFSMVSFDSNIKSVFSTIQPSDMTTELWKFFINRIDTLLSTMILSIYTIRSGVDALSSRLEQYDEGKIDIVLLLDFEENNVLTIIEVISLLYKNKDKYDKSKSFNHNLYKMFKLKKDTLSRTSEEKRDFLKFLTELDKKQELSYYIWQGISTFNEVYECEMDRIKQCK